MLYYQYFLEESDNHSMKNIFFLLLIISCQQKEMPVDESLSSSLLSTHILQLEDPGNHSMELAEVTLVTSDGLYSDSSESLNDFLRQNLTLTNAFFTDIQVKSDDSTQKNYTLFIKPESPGTINIYLPGNSLKYDSSNFYPNEISLNITVQ